MQNEEQKVLKIYHDPQQGFTSPEQIYKKLNKEIKLKRIKEIIKQTQNKQIFAQKPEKQRLVPIHNPVNSYQFDLTFYTQYKKVNNNYHILLCIIDTNTRYAYVYPMKDKKQNTIQTNLEKFINSTPNIYLVQTDNESGVGNSIKKLFKENDIILKMFNKKDSPNATMIVERFNKSIRHLIDQYMESYDTHKFIDQLPNLVYNYNNRVHSSIQMTPNEAKNKNYYDKKKFHRKQEVLDNNDIQLQQNQQARIYKDRELFQKGQKNVTKELFKIKEKQGNQYILEDDKQNEQLVPAYKIKEQNQQILQNPNLKKQTKKKNKNKVDLDEQKKENKQYRKLKKEFGDDQLVNYLKKEKQQKEDTQKQQKKLKRMGIDDKNIIKKKK